MTSRGEKIKAARKAKKMSQEELGAACGTNKQTIYKYETGIITNIPFDRLEKIAEALDISPAYIMGWKNGDKLPFNTLTKEKAPAPITESERNIVKIAGRDGSFVERRLTDDQVEALRSIIDQFPEAGDDI